MPALWLLNIQVVSLHRMATRAGQSTSARADHRDPHAWLGGDGLAADARNGPTQAGRQRTDPADSSEAETREQRLVRASDRTADARAPRQRQRRRRHRHHRAGGKAPPRSRRPTGTGRDLFATLCMSPIACKGVIFRRYSGQATTVPKGTRMGWGWLGNPNGAQLPRPRPHDSTSPVDHRNSCHGNKPGVTYP